MLANTMLTTPAVLSSLVFLTMASHACTAEGLSLSPVLHEMWSWMRAEGPSIGIIGLATLPVLRVPTLVRAPNGCASVASHGPLIQSVLASVSCARNPPRSSALCASSRVTHTVFHSRSSRENRANFPMLRDRSSVELLRLPTSCNRGRVLALKREMPIERPHNGLCLNQWSAGAHVHVTWGSVSLGLLACLFPMFGLIMVTASLPCFLVTRLIMILVLLSMGVGLLHCASAINIAGTALFSMILTTCLTFKPAFKWLA